MRNIIFTVVLVTIFLCSCFNNKPAKKIDSCNFTTYEISFFDGWRTRFSFTTDTSKLYLATYNADTLKYGILPDSIFEIINKNAFSII